MWTKGIATGSVVIPFLAAGLGVAVSEATLWTGVILGLLFMAATGGLLVMDLDRPDRFHYVLLRPQWNSWLVKGAYIIIAFGGLLSLWMVLKLLGVTWATTALAWPLVVLSFATAVYTAFLFAQAKGRSFWQSPALPVHMLAHATMAGAAALYVVSFFVVDLRPLREALERTLALGIVAGLLVLWAELGIGHPDRDATRAAKTIYQGRYRTLFWGGSVLLGSLVPLVLIGFGVLFSAPMAVAAVSILTLVGIFATEHAWVEAPQLIPLA